MQKFVLADKDGHIAGQQKLEAGKFIHSATVKSNDPITRVIAGGCDSALLAVLEDPAPTSPDARLFQLHTWTVSVDADDPRAYTIIKEVPLPAVSQPQKVAFAIAALRELYHDVDFVDWARNWLSGENRSGEAAQACYTALSKETAAASALEELAAWGEAAGNDAEMMHAQEDLSARAMAVVAAADLLAGATPDAMELKTLLARALTGIEKYGRGVDLVHLAEHVIAGPLES